MARSAYPGKDNVEQHYPESRFDRLSRNFIRSPLNATRINNATFRGDVQLTEKDSTFARLSFNLGDFTREPALPAPAHTPVVREAPSWSVGSGHTRTFGPTLVNEFRFAWNRVDVDQDGTLERDDVIAGSLDPDVTSSSPVFNLTGFTGLGVQPPGFGNIPLLKSSGVWNLSNNTSWIRNNHTLKLGFDYQALRITTSATLQGRGSFSFPGFFTQNPQRRPGSGSSVADLLLGLPHAVNIGTRSVATERAHNFYWYLQDDWTVRYRRDSPADEQSTVLRLRGNEPYQ